MEKTGLIMITIGLLLCAVAVCLFVYCATLKDDDTDNVLDAEREEVKNDVLEMMKELGGDEEE